VYKRCASEEDVRKGSYEHEVYRLLKLIEDRYESGTFDKERISFDPARNYPWPYQGEPLRQPIPQAMLRASPGRRYSPGRFRID
jgi:hypothetical protein